MRKLFTTRVLMVLAAMTMVFAVSCKKKDVKKIEVDNQFAVALFCDNVALKDIINDMDGTTDSWLRVRNDSLFAYYADTIDGVLKASDFLGDLKDTDFTTSTNFSLNGVYDNEEHDTTLFSEGFTTIPFVYDGFDIEEVIMRSGVFSFDVTITPEIPMLKQIVIFSEQLVSPEDEQPLMITIDYEKGNKIVDLSGYKLRPDGNKNVNFSSYITFHYNPQVGFDGGSYTSDLVGGITNAKFKTVYAIVTKPLDSLYTDVQPIDFGINGLSGSAMLPVPRVALTYRNTFGLKAECDVTKFEFMNSVTGLTTNLIATDHIDIDINPTNGEYRGFVIQGFTDQIDALAGYTQLDFNGEVNLAMPGDHISISDTSQVDVIANVEMPMSFKISELCYVDTVDVKFGQDVNIQNYLDEIDFTIDYDNQIPVDVKLQGIFLSNNHVVDSLFDNGGAILYKQNSSLKCVVTDRKLDNVMKANKMILRLGLDTNFEGEPETVILKESDNIFLRMKMLTKTNEINIDDIL